MGDKGLEDRLERVDYYTTGSLRFPSEDEEVYPQRGAGGPPRKHFIYFKILPRSSSGITSSNEQEFRLPISSCL